MLDIKAIRKESEWFAQALARRGGDSNFGPVIELDERRRALIVEGDRLRNEKSTAEKGMKSVPKPSPEFDEFRARMKGIAESIKKISDEQNDVDAQQRALLLSVPNVPSDACPDGADEADNVVVRVVGTPAKRDFDVVAHDIWATERGFWTKKEQPSSPGLVFGLSGSCAS